MALPVSWVIGKITGVCMPSLGLSWTWGGVSLVCTFVLPPVWGAPIPLEVFGVMGSATLVVSAFMEQRRWKREQENPRKLLTPWRALKYRMGRAIVSLVVAVTVIFHLTFLGAALSIIGLAIMWCCGERKVLRALLLAKAGAVISQYDANAVGRLERAVHDLTERIRHG